MNPYAANFQVPAAAPVAAPVAAAAAAGGAAGLPGDGSEQDAAWAEDPGQSVDGGGGGGYWDEHGQHHPGYDGSYDPAAAYHPDGYDPVYHQVMESCWYKVYDPHVCLPHSSGVI